MYGNDWPMLPRAHMLLLLLAVIGLGVLAYQARPATPHLSRWSGTELTNSIAGVMTAAGDSDVITGQAQPIQLGRGKPEVADADVPIGNPLGLPNTVMTQGYGVGTHAPAEVWGAIDLAIDGDGDGHADPDGTWNTPVYATHAGVVRLSRDTWPAGNHIWVEGARYKTGYAHLQSFAVEDGQYVERGQLIGYVGSTGMSSGPHLDYQVWKDGVNVNPLDYGALE